MKNTIKIVAVALLVAGCIKLGWPGIMIGAGVWLLRWSDRPITIGL